MAVITPGRAGCTFDGETAGTDLAVLTEMAVPIVDATGDATVGDDTGNGIAGVDVRTGALAAAAAARARTASSNEPSSSKVFALPFPDALGSSAGVAGTGADCAAVVGWTTAPAAPIG